jgi:hypothetical protein
LNPELLKQAGVNDQDVNAVFELREKLLDEAEGGAAEAVGGHAAGAVTE